MNDPTPGSDSPPALDDVVAAWDAVWQAVEPDARQRLLERAVTPGVEFVGPPPAGRLVGASEIAVFVGGFLKRWPGARVAIATGIDAHNGWARYGWTIRGAGGEVLLEGVDVAEVAPDGRLQRIVMFYGALPPLDAAAQVAPADG
jgi:hypothetical protein